METALEMKPFQRAIHGNGKNELKELDAPVHRWWRFVLAFPPHLVNEYLDSFDCSGPRCTVLDPFSGTGTTLVEAKKRRCRAVGLEALDFCHLASTVKTNWDIDVNLLQSTYDALRAGIGKDFARFGFFVNAGDLFLEFRNGKTPAICKLELDPEQAKMLGKGYVSERPLQKLLVIRQHVESLAPGSVADFFRLALGAASIPSSNVGFGPEIYRKKAKPDEDVWRIFTDQSEMMLADLRAIQSTSYGKSEVHHHDCRTLAPLKSLKVNAVITSPPYPNEKNYGRITRIENLIAGCVKDRDDLKRLKKGLLRSNSQNMYKGDDDDQFVVKFERIQRIANEIEDRRIELGKTSGWERLYATVTRHYFGGMYKHLKNIFDSLKPGGKCAYVVGDQMSFLMVFIPTGQILAEIAEDIGFRVDRIDLWRERWSSASKLPIREEVVVLERR